jgi:hypothetical protein
MNSSWKFGKRPGVQAYGLNLEHQKCILDKMTECMTQMQMLPKNSLSQIEKISEESKKPSQQSRKPRKPKKPALRPFQKGIILSNKSLKELFCYLRLTYNQQNSSPNIDFILTRRLNFDIIEQLFAVLRAMGFTPICLGVQIPNSKLYSGGKCSMHHTTNTEDISVSSSEGAGSGIWDGVLVLSVGTVGFVDCGAILSCLERRFLVSRRTANSGITDGNHPTAPEKSPFRLLVDGQSAPGLPQAVATPGLLVEPALSVS